MTFAVYGNAKYPTLAMKEIRFAAFPEKVMVRTSRSRVVEVMVVMVAA